MTEKALTSYDEVPYTSFPYPQTHPDRLATIATLFGMTPAPIPSCRVLEIGCGMGGNLLPMACTYADARFVGIDLSQRQIQVAQDHKRELGLTNIDFSSVNILEFESKKGEFDYIICHGVYSWVPAAVQKRILQICKSSLSENGVAYVSYNTYPGWHFQQIIREMMCYHAKEHFPDPGTRLGQAKAILKFVADSVASSNDPYSVLLKTEADMLRHKPDSYLYHEYLEDENQPIYFRDFAEAADNAGLQYLGEAEHHLMLATTLPNSAAQTLRGLGNEPVRLQQYLDFLRNTKFRQSLLCQPNIQLDTNRNPDRVRSFYIGSRNEIAEENANLTDKSMVTFRSPGGSLQTDRPPTKTAMKLLGERWPETVSFDELCESVDEVLNAPTNQDELAATLYDGFLRTNLLEFHVTPPLYTTKIADKPKVSRYARHQATQGELITNLRHELVRVSKPDRMYFQYFDGARTVAEVERTLTNHAEFDSSNSNAAQFNNFARAALFLRSST